MWGLAAQQAIIESVALKPSDLTAEEAEPEAVPSAAADKHACPKCGRVVKRGKHLHAKYCKGKR